MTQSQRKSKQTIIATLYGLVFLLFFGITVFALFPASQQVSPVTISIEPLKIISTETIELSNGVVDMFVQIENPNNSFGIKTLPYTINLSDSTGTPQTISGTTFVLPGEKTIFIPLLNYPRGYSIDGFTIDDTSYRWTQFSRNELPELVVRNVRAEVSSKAGNPFIIMGTVTNRSVYDLRNIELTVVVSNNQNDTIAINKTIVRLLTQGESRDFEFAWNDPIPGFDISNVSIYPRSNVLDNDEFLIRVNTTPIESVNR